MVGKNNPYSPSNSPNSGVSGSSGIDGVSGSSISPNVKPKIQNQELSQNIGQPPEDDNMSTEILPPIGGDADTSGLQQSAPNFGSASIASEQLSDTSSLIPFIDVISNQYLSIV